MVSLDVEFATFGPFHERANGRFLSLVPCLPISKRMGTIPSIGAEFNTTGD